MKLNLYALMAVLFVTEIAALDIFASIDRTALSIFDGIVHRVELYVRSSKALNDRLKFIGTAIENLDDTWAEWTKWTVSLPAEEYDPKQLAKDNEFLELAKFAKYKLYTEFSDQNRLIYHFGMRNSWNYFVALDSLLDVIFEERIKENNPELTDTFLTSDFIAIADLKNFMAWRGVSGSDDIEWVGIGLVAAYKFTNNPVFLDKDYEWNGARGCKQLYEEIYADFYDKQNGGIYWDSNEKYKGSISNSLWVLWSAEMYQATGDKKYLDEALKV